MSSTSARIDAYAPRRRYAMDGGSTVAPPGGRGSVVAPRGADRVSCLARTVAALRAPALRPAGRGRGVHGRHVVGSLPPVDRARRGERLRVGLARVGAAGDATTLWRRLGAGAAV